MHGQQERGRKVTAMYWSLVLLVAACCAGRAAADGVVPAFVCATTEPHPHVQVRLSAGWLLTRHKGGMLLCGPFRLSTAAYTLPHCAHSSL